MRSAGGYCNVFLNVRSAIVNIDYRSIVQERVSGLSIAKSNIPDHIESEVGNEAEEYVESIMGSQLIVRVDTPLVNSRRRQHSAPGSAGGEDIDHADFLGQSGNTPSPGLRKEVKKIRRTIINEPSSPSTGGRLVVTEAEVHVSADTSVEQLINKLSTDQTRGSAGRDDRRSRNARTGSGGVGFFVKNEIFVDFNVSVLTESYEGILCLKLVQKNREFYIIAMCLLRYLPPENSSRHMNFSTI